MIRYELSYEGLEGTVTQAHIHFGQVAPARIAHTSASNSPALMYANVHSTAFPPGEIRGQIQQGAGHGH